MTTTFPPLTNNPTFSEVHKWHRKLHDYCRTTVVAPTEYAGPTQTAGTLYHLGHSMTDEEWTQFLGNPLADPTTRTEPPPPPEEPANNATHGALAAYTRAMAARQLIMDHTIQFAIKVRESISPRICFALAADGDITPLPAYHIINFVITTYGVMTNSEIQAIQNQLSSLRFSTADNFHSETAALAITFANLAIGHQPVSSAQQMLYLANATSHIPSITTAIQQYRANHPQLPDQSYPAMVSFISTQLQNNPTDTSHDHGYALAASVPAPRSLQSEITAAVAQALAAQQPPVTNKRTRPPRGDPQSTQASSIPSSSIGSCVFHPHMSHNIMQCFHFAHCLHDASPKTLSQLNAHLTALFPSPPKK